MQNKFGTIKLAYKVGKVTVGLASHWPYHLYGLSALGRDVPVGVAYGTVYLFNFLPINCKAQDTSGGGLVAHTVTYVEQPDFAW